MLSTRSILQLAEQGQSARRGSSSAQSSHTHIQPKPGITQALQCGSWIATIILAHPTQRPTMLLLQCLSASMTFLALLLLHQCRLPPLPLQPRCTDAQVQAVEVALCRMVLTRQLQLQAKAKHPHNHQSQSLRPASLAKMPPRESMKRRWKRGC